ncbi:MFS transporter [Mycobacterium sp. NPDC051804]|uniref:MFS transporter n=1 Tax=Mycobacterium sp. NPDC051804 TaxID=3364295 RepID=UPI0037AA15FE
MKSESAAVPTTSLTAFTVWFMAVAAALGTASMYPLQPAVSPIADALHASLPAVGASLAWGPVGYLLGLALLVPLIDQYRPRRVLSIQFAALGAALALNAAVTTLWGFAILAVVVGAGSAVGAQLSSAAGRLADQRRRATVLGIVTAGISAGIIIGRILGGYLADQIGWRPMLIVFATACFIIASVTRYVLPDVSASSTTGYLETLRGLPGLYRKHAVLRLAGCRGALWFFAFCALWAGLAVALSLPPYSYSPERIGGYAIAGLSGIFATRIAGHWTDRVGARPVVLAGLVVAAAAALALAALLPITPLAFACLALFDAGLFAAQVANQSTVLAINPSAPAQFNSAYMVVYFIGGSLGTACGAAAASATGWPMTAIAAAATICGAAVLTAVTRSLARHC